MQLEVSYSFLLLPLEGINHKNSSMFMILQLLSSSKSKLTTNIIDEIVFISSKHIYQQSRMLIKICWKLL